MMSAMLRLVVGQVSNV